MGCGGVNLGTDLVEKMGFGQTNSQLISGLSRVGHHRAASNQNIADRKELMKGGREEGEDHPMWQYDSCHFWSVTEPASFFH